MVLKRNSDKQLKFWSLVGPVTLRNYVGLSVIEVDIEKSERVDR